MRFLRSNRQARWVRPSDFWPTPRQELLLRAALLQGSASLDAWGRWKAGSAEPDEGERRLLPHVYRNLSLQGLCDPPLTRLAGAYKANRYRTALVLQATVPLLTSFRDARLDTLLLKGSALILKYYRDPGLRPIADVDLLVRPPQLSRAVSLLLDCGWQPKLEVPIAESASATHSAAFRNAWGLELDLHWHVLEDCLELDADEDFWDEAVAARLHDAETSVLAVTDQLLHVCVHGAKWSPIPPCRWVADTVTILGSAAAEVDWGRLVAQALKRRLVLPLADTLRFIRDRFQASVPLAVIEQLEAVESTRLERLAYRARACAPELRGPVMALALQHKTYRRTIRATAGHARLGFLDFLKNAWGVIRVWWLPLVATVKGIRRSWMISSWHMLRFWREKRREHR